MNDFWVQLLQTEDECLGKLEEAEKEIKLIKEEKSKEATKEVERLKVCYQEEIENKKENAVKEIDELKKSLKKDQEEKSLEAANMFRSHKDTIVALLFKTVLNVQIE